MSTLDLTDQSIILSLNYLQGRYAKKYSYPSQKKILSILSNVYYIDICLRTLNYHLAKLEKLKFIYRQRRDPLTPNGLNIYQSTLYSLGKRSYRTLAHLMGTLKNGYYSIRKYLHNTHISSRKELEEDKRFLSPDENIRRFKELRTKLS